MKKPTRSLLMNTAISLSALGLIITVSSNSFTEKDTQTTTHTHDVAANGASRSSRQGQTTANTYTQPHRVNIPVKTKNRIPDKGRADNSSTFLDRENLKFGTAMPVYKDSMIDMLKEEAKDNTPAALSKEEIKKLEDNGDLIW